MASLPRLDGETDALYVSRCLSEVRQRAANQAGFLRRVLRAWQAGEVLDLPEIKESFG